MHIMWYESKMVNETLDSIQQALKYTKLPIKFKFCLNSQTYLGEPLIGSPEDMFKEFLDHSLFKTNQVEIEYKTNKDPFYNIGDWRREIYDTNSKYTVWGEPDTLVPSDFFYILEKYTNPKPHVLSLSSRKMWDITWRPLELESIKDNPNPSPELSHYTYINLDQLNHINQLQGDIKIKKLEKHKIEGALLALSSNLPYPWMGDNHHFIYEDTAFEVFLYIKNIPLYYIATRIKGHNRFHPLKRENISTEKNSKPYQQYAYASYKAMADFISKLKKS